MGRTVDSVARLLQATVGLDGADPRQPASLPSEDYVAAVRDALPDLRGVRIGVLAEGLDPAAAGVTSAVHDAFLTAMRRLESVGATVVEVSVPWHTAGGDLNLAGCIEGMHALLRGGGNGYQWNGHYLPDLALTVAEQLQRTAPEWSLELKIIAICGQLLNEKFGGAVYGSAHNRHAELKRGYDHVLEQVDYLALPTAPWTAPALPGAESPATQILRGWAGSANTAPFNVSGHPAISLPVCESEGMPVGLMLVGSYFSEASLLGTSRTIEQALGWLPAHFSDQRRGPK
jgi:amidase